MAGRKCLMDATHCKIMAAMIKLRMAASPELPHSAGPGKKRALHAEGPTFTGGERGIRTLDKPFEPILP
jgi:hypothetical protein